MSPLSVAEQALAESTNLKTLNAFVCIAAEQALQQAKESVRRYAEQKPLSSLDGVTVAIKDNFCTKNIATTCASR